MTRAKESAGSLFERHAVLEAKNRVLEAEVRQRQRKLREPMLTIELGDAVDDSIIAIHGVQVLKNPMIREAWQELAGRLAGRVGEPFFAVQRQVGSSNQDFNMRPVFWIGDVTEQPITFGKEISGFNSLRFRSTTLAMGDTALCAGLSFEVDKLSFEPNATDEGPVLGRVFVSDHYRHFDEDLVYKHLDTPISAVNRRAGDSDCRLYTEIGQRLPSGIKIAVKDMFQLEVIVGAEEIGQWVTDTSNFPGEQRVVSRLMDVRSSVAVS